MTDQLRKQNKRIYKISFRSKYNKVP